MLSLRMVHGWKRLRIENLLLMHGIALRKYSEELPLEEKEQSSQVGWENNRAQSRRRKLGATFWKGQITFKIRQKDFFQPRRRKI